MSTTEKPKRDWVLILVMIGTGLIGTSLFSPLINSLFLEMGKPYVQILMRQNDQDPRNASFFLSNSGESAATHLKFLLQMPQKILSFTNFSTENATWNRNTSTIIDANLKRFAQGNGSFVNINLTMAKPDKNYHVFATFDQGSATGTWSLQPRIPWATLFFTVIVPAYVVGATVGFLWWFKTRQGWLTSYRWKCYGPCNNL